MVVVFVLLTLFVDAAHGTVYRCDRWSHRRCSAALRVSTVMLVFHIVCSLSEGCRASGLQPDSRGFNSRINTPGRLFSCPRASVIKLYNLVLAIFWVWEASIKIGVLVSEG